MTNHKFCTECGNEVRRSTNVCDSCGYDSKNEMIHKTELEKSIFSKLEQHAPYCFKCKDLLSDKKIKELKKIPYTFCEKCFPYDVGFSFLTRKDHYKFAEKEEWLVIYRKLLNGEYPEHSSVINKVEEDLTEEEKTIFLLDYIYTVIKKKKWKLW